MKGKKVKPLKNRLIVRRDEVETTTAGGIILVSEESKNKKANTGTVIAIGPDVTALKLADSVSFGSYAGHEMEINGADCVILDEDDILGIVELIEEE